jgi:hypothetical protein
MYVTNLGNTTLVWKICIICEIGLCLLLMITGHLYCNQTYCSSYFYVIETTMMCYVVFRGRKPKVYESWRVYSEYVIGFSNAAL